MRHRETNTMYGSLVRLQTTHSETAIWISLALSWLSIRRLIALWKCCRVIWMQWYAFLLRTCSLHHPCNEPHHNDHIWCLTRGVLVYRVNLSNTSSDSVSYFMCCWLIFDCLVNWTQAADIWLFTQLDHQSVWACIRDLFSSRSINYLINQPMNEWMMMHWHIDALASNVYCF